MERRKLVVIGNGMAGVRCVEEILNINREAFEITIFGKEPHPNYNRILLSKVLQGDTSIDDITINDWKWYEDNQIKLYTNEAVVKLDSKKRLLTTESGRKVDYDELIIATGSLPFMLPLPGANKQGVTAFRDIRDCETMVETAKKHDKAVVIGGGLLGLEAARGLLNLGMQVDVVHIHGSLMDRQLDATAGKMLQDELEKQGMRFLLEKHSEEIIGRSRVVGLKFKDGTKTNADLLVMAVGVRPNVQLAKDSGIGTNRAILVNDYMQTDVPNIYAVGECAEHRGTVYGLVAPLYEQGKILAQTMCGIQNDGYHGSITATQLKVSGVDVFSAGEFMDSKEVKSLKWYDGIRNTYKKIVVRDGKIVGAVLFGDISEGPQLFSMIKQGKDFSVYEKESMSSASGQESNEAKIAAMSDKEQVCACNGVSKGSILQAIQEHGLQTVDEIKKCTKASSSCGSCKPLVGHILDYFKQHGSGVQEEKETICSCTDYSHEEVIEEIQKHDFAEAADIRSALNWSAAQGCKICSPALTYYLAVHGRNLPKEAQSISNEGLQADGSYAIMPRMYGGVTSSEQLRQIADVVDRYRIPLVKLSNGPMLSLQGILADDYQAVKSEFEPKQAGRPAFIYGKLIQTIGTSSGFPYEKGAFQDSLQLGAALERRIEGLQLPSQITISVSASPYHSAGSLAKDIGIVGVPGGWELHVGGSAERQVMAGQLLCTVVDAAELIDFTSAFLQYYRESAHYMEQVAQWMERVGLLHIREMLFDPAHVEQFNKRLDLSLFSIDEEAEAILPTITQQTAAAAR
ncbi:nitrite reductase large subunit NirB [Paenibacillus solisilvae]|uniref:Nitrite reductase large subunit NirB n=1 Tax=Paenibacillus solisilvae TaxID=2486751 RepID=A0ABW0VW15_9BACL